MSQPRFRPFAARDGQLCALAIAALWVAAFPSHAAISENSDPELALFIWDPVREVSYTKDLGLRANQFFATAQQDAGYQQFWTFSGSSDVPLQQLVNLNTPSTSLRWAVLGFDRDGVGLATPGDFRTFMTLEQGPAQGQANPNYDQMRSWITLDWVTANSQMASSLIVGLNNNNTNNPFNLQTPPGAAIDLAFNGSSFTAKGQPGYFDPPGESIPIFTEALNASITNAVGKSSWFYYLTSAQGNTNAPVVVDEFDNLAADGYWGLAKDPATGNFVLSYTLTPALASVSAVTAEGRARASLTELRSGAATRLVSPPKGEFADWCPPMVSAVPEPSAWGLLGAGALALWLARRRKAGGARAEPSLR